MKYFSKILLFTLMATYFSGSMFAQSEETNESRIRVPNGSTNVNVQSHDPMVSVVNHDPRHDDIDPRFGVHAPKMHEYPATKQQEDMIVKLVKNMSFDSNKLEAAKVCLALRPVSMDCVLRIAKLFSFDDSRLEFLKYAYEYSYGKHEFHKTYKYFTFTSNYDALMMYIEKYDKKHRKPSAEIVKPRPVLHSR